MPEVVRVMLDGTTIEFDRGNFDSFCVYVRDPSGVRRAPTDSEYFAELHSLGLVYTPDGIYGEFVALYDLSTEDLDIQVLRHIDRAAAHYQNDSQRVVRLFTILYMAMIAEEKRANTRLGKRIKRLGVHELLVGGRTIDDAANFMRGMSWRAIDAMCQERGF
jgi:hypothetical protein